MGQMKEQISDWMVSNKLIRFHVLKGKGVQQTMLGRVMTFDEQQGLLLIYNVDEKKVYNLKLTEIENVFPAE